MPKSACCNLHNTTKHYLVSFALCFSCTLFWDWYQFLLRVSLWNTLPPRVPKFQVAHKNTFPPLVDSFSRIRLTLNVILMIMWKTCNYSLYDKYFLCNNLWSFLVTVASLCIPQLEVLKDSNIYSEKKFQQMNLHLWSHWSICCKYLSEQLVVFTEHWKFISETTCFVFHFKLPMNCVSFVASKPEAWFWALARFYRFKILEYRLFKFCNRI